MAYFVVQRNADSVPSVPLPKLFPTREAALAALSSAAGTGVIAVDADVFIVDLDKAAPVLLVPVQPAEGVGTLDERAADEVYAPGPLSAFGDEASLAAALKRAASSLEDEGIVAPASVEAESGDATAEEPAELEDEESAQVEDEEPAEVEASGEADMSLEPDADVTDTGERTWPWANVEAYEPQGTVVAETSSPDLAADDDGALESDTPLETASEEDASEEDAPADDDRDDEFVASVDAPDAEVAPFGTEIEPAWAGEAPDAASFAVQAEPADDGVLAEVVAEPLGVTPERDDISAAIFELTTAPQEPAADDRTLITSAPVDGEDAYLPRPVILGDYAEADAASEPVVQLTQPASHDQTPPEETTEDDDESGFDLSAALGGLVGAPAEVGYEATGDLDLAEYTCQDCIYSNTCPKVGQATPADCGSFQWRSE